MSEIREHVMAANPITGLKVGHLNYSADASFKTDSGIVGHLTFIDTFNKKRAVKPYTFRVREEGS